MAAKILCSIGDEGVTVGKLVNKYRVKKELVDDAVFYLIEKNKIYLETKIHKS